MAKIKSEKNTSNTKQYTVEYALDADTKGTYRYVALGDDGKPITETNTRLDIGSNVIYALKSTFPKAPKRVTVTFDVEI